MRRWVVGFELHHKLLLSVHQLALSAVFRRMAINEGAVLVGHAAILAAPGSKRTAEQLPHQSYKGHAASPLMATLEEFKALRDGVPGEVQVELYKLMTADPDASIRRMVEIKRDDGHLR